MRGCVVSKALTAAMVCGLTCGTAMAEALKFNMKDPKGVHNISFLLDSQLEPIMGLASGITGEVEFDPADPSKTTGKIIIKADSLHIENKGMEETLHGPDWIDVKTYPTIELAFKSVKDVKKLGDDRHEMTVVGDIMIRGQTKEISAPVVATYIPGGLAKRQRRAEGDLLVLRSRFTIDRKDFGIKLDMGDSVVAEKIELNVAIVGSYEKE